MEEWDISLTGYSTSHQSLAGTRTAKQQNATRDTRTQIDKLLGKTQELNNFR